MREVVEIENSVEVDYDAGEAEFIVISASRKKIGVKQGSWIIDSVVVIDAELKKAKEQGLHAKKTVGTSRSSSRTSRGRKHISPIKNRRYSALDRYRSLSLNPSHADCVTPIRESSVSLRRRSWDMGLDSQSERKPLVVPGKRALSRRMTSLSFHMQSIDEECPIDRTDIAPTPTLNARNQVWSKRAQSLSLRRNRSDEENMGGCDDMTSPNKARSHDGMFAKRAASLSVRRRQPNGDETLTSHKASLARDSPLGFRRKHNSATKLKLDERNTNPLSLLSSRRTSRRSFKILPHQEGESS